MTPEHTLTRLFIFAKTPVAGQVKTRLIPALGPAGAARLAAIMLEHTVAQALAAQAQHSGIVVELCVAPDPSAPFWQWAAAHSELAISAQSAGDLGQRLHQAATGAVARGERAMLIGTDCPDITTQRLLEATMALARYDAVLHPTLDGGYALLGLRRAPASLFTDMPWSTEQVAELTRIRLQQQHMTLITMPTLQDIDRPGDLAAMPLAWQNGLRGT